MDAAKIPGWMMSMGDLAFFYLDLLRALGSARRASRRALRRRLDRRRDGDPQHRPARVADAARAGRRGERRRRRSTTSSSGARRSSPAASSMTRSSRKRGSRRRPSSTSTSSCRTAPGWRGSPGIPRLHNPQLPYWLHRIDVPTLLIWGENDRVDPVRLPQAVPERDQAGQAHRPCRKPATRSRSSAPATPRARLKTFLQGAKG